MLWEIVGAIVAAVLSAVGSAKAVRAIVAHEQRQCDARLDAYKEGLQHGEQHK